uniref:AraC family transcriptional regulator n=1 Tax=Meloidogyne hapla TaxID=6305 RepID=A0A1I8BZQ7_MELHA
KEASVVHPIAAASILIVVNGSATIIPNEGNGEKIEKGDVLFLPQQIEAKLSEKFDNFLAFRAHTPVPIYFIAPLMLETQPRKIIIMNQPFEDNHTLQIKVFNHIKII